MSIFHPHVEAIFPHMGAAILNHNALYPEVLGFQLLNYK